MFDVKALLREVAEGSISPDAACDRLRQNGIAYAELGDVKIDLHRRKRRGMPEAVYCAGKTSEQVLRIIEAHDAASENVLCTRVSAEMAAEVLARRPDLTYHPAARLIISEKHTPAARTGSILVLTAGTSDIPVAEEAAISAEMMGSHVERVFDVGVAGIHRLFGAAAEPMKRARVIIVVAGMEGALPSVVAGLAAVPVIAVPTSVGYGTAFGGITALLGMLNSCSGGLAVVNIDNGFGAAAMAHMINQLGAPADPEAK